MQFNAIDINSLFFKQVYQYALENYPQALAYLGIAPEKFNIENFLNKYFQTQFIQDISSDPTANVEGKSIARFKAELGIPFMKYIVFKTLFDKMVEMYGIEVAKFLARNLFNGIFYLHDSAHLSCYCLGVDLSKLLFDGINWGYLHSLPPKKPRTFINQVKEVVIELSHEWAGAIGLPCLIILYTYIYCKYYGIEKEINKKEVIDDFQNLVHTLNRELRAAFQSPFTNISYFDRYCLDEIMEYVYSWMLSENGWDKETFIEKVMKVQEIVMEFLSKGDPKTGSLYRFPVQTVNLTKDKKGNIRDKEFLKIVCKYNTKGQMNIYVSDNVERFSFCCRYQSSVKDIKFDSFGNGGINIGSIHIVTINLNRIALDVKIKSSKENKDNLKNNFISLLLLRMFEAKKILDAFREVLRDKIKQGFYKFFNLKWFDLDKHFFSTIGFVGLYEAMETLGLNIKDKFAVEVMQTMDKVIEDFNKNGKGIMYNLEQIPGEGACAILPKIDKLFYGEENVPYVLYANQFIPLYVEHSILDKIEIEGKFFKYCSGGAISHINIMHELKPEEVEKMIKMVVKAGIEHFALNPVFSICENNHYIIGKVEKCPICNAKIKDWLTRVVGFFTKVSTWQKDRRDWEFNKRIWFDLS